ncbi:Sin3 associated polypeptide p18-domain-containing protein [Dendryphion nanum]|uniref:Sin3 associated polypeptide p18-domain-containing protein n=1 Tax=Dendryphion nanum TaxID=256645 RepID=A0A9P9CZU1_9PLEO|nr:Sin3 associated polypeptide p18-domain-containing protein [Dendryphion nanum]
MSGRDPTKEIDRQTTAPFLLRLFYKKGAYHNLDDFTSPRLPPHLQIYTWETCTLSELTQLFLTALPSLLPTPFTGSRIVFQLVFPDLKASSPRYISRELGNIIVGAVGYNAEDKDVEMQEDEDEVTNVKLALKQLDGELNKALRDAKFVTGDYVTAAVFPPHSDGTVPDAPPPPRPMGRGPPPRDGYGGRGGRENGFGGRGEFGYGGRGRGGHRFEERRGSGGGVPSGEWRRGDVPPERDNHWRGGSGGGSRGPRLRGGRW